MTDLLSTITSQMIKIRDVVDGKGLDSSNRHYVKKILEELARNCDFANYRAAEPGEELVYELDAPRKDTASLYLVSDGVGVVSPPHEHRTWAIIVGISGQEMNQIYDVLDSESKKAQQSNVVIVGKNDTITMESHQVHGTVSIGPEATFHLHLYGCSLDLLQPFSARTYSVVPVNSKR